MSSFLFLVACIAIIILLVWVLQNRNVGHDQPSRGLLAMKDDVTPEQPVRGRHKTRTGRHRQHR